MSLLGRIFGRRGRADAPDAEELLEDVEEIDEDGGDGDGLRGDGETAYDATAAHAQLLRRTRHEAEADAVRHAEDMLARQFPIAAEAESIAGSRLAELRVEYLAKDTELSRRRANCEHEIARREVQRSASTAALVAAGVPADQVDVGALFSNRLANWKLAVVLAVGGGIGYLLAASDLGTIAIACAVILALAVAVWLYASGPEEIEERELTALREAHAENCAALTALNSEVARLEIEREALRGETRGAAEGEVAFAARLAAAYASAAFSAMPAGSLEGGRKFADQEEPTVALPEWVLALEQVTA